MRLHSMRLMVMACAAAVAAMVPAGRLDAAGQSSPTFRFAADVFTGCSAPVAVGSTALQASVSLDQRSLVSSRVAGPAISVELGFQAAAGGFDSDGDGIADGDDADDDGDGVPDALDERPFDADGDGVNNVGADPDDDNDGLCDWEEGPFGTSPLDGDTDDDDQSDWAEWVAGTDGTDADDRFRIEAVSLATGTGQPVIHWRGVNGRRYTLFSSTNITGGPSWNAAWATNVVDTGEVQREAAVADAPAFFRLRVERP